MNHESGGIHMLFLFIIMALFIFVASFPLKKLIRSFRKQPIQEDVGTNLQEGIFFISLFCLFFVGFYLNYGDAEGGEALLFYSEIQKYSTGYASLSKEYVSSLSFVLVLGVLAYQVIRTRIDKISPLLYVLCCSILLFNIVIGLIYLTHTGFTNYPESLFSSLTVSILQVAYFSLSTLFLARLKESMDYFILEFKNKALDEHSRLPKWMQPFLTSYMKLPILWMIVLFPVAFVLQFFLILFGQQPDSFIKAFLETSSYTYSKLPAPPPEVILGDGHYLCTVAVKGHPKLVKPLRAGIRHGERITVNRQLLIANAFENILEQYTPRIHSIIRNLYNQYGYPISRHIKSNWSADLVYLLMKPAEWLFLFVLYFVDKKPENRINIQYSELRK